MEKRKPGKICKLPESVINKIAAGEVVVRPSAAVKELIENSVDAGATKVTVECENGGLDILSVTDDGHGIAAEDLPLLCQRFTTSKLKKYEDLQEITTYGFRGEALASLSYVSVLKITSKPKEQGTAFEAWYKSGRIVGAEGDETAEAIPRPCSGNNGTTICARNMFYSVTERRTALNGSREYFKILSVVRKYAIHLPHVHFVCRKVGSKIADYVSSSTDRKEIITNLYGKKVVGNLVDVDFQKPDIFLTKVTGLVSNPTSPSTKTIAIMFINGIFAIMCLTPNIERLVKCSKIKNKLKDIYSYYLPKGKLKYFAYIAISIDPGHIDVNVHPSKKEVIFMYEDEIIEQLGDAIEVCIRSCYTTNTLDTVQTTLVPPTFEPSPPRPADKKLQQKEKIRPMDNLKIEDIWKSSQNKQLEAFLPGDKSKPLHPIAQKLLSELRKSASTLKDEQEVIEKHTYVGFVTADMLLIQYRTKLLSLDAHSLIKAWVYQTAVNSYGHYDVYKIEPPIDLTDIFVTDSTKTLDMFQKNKKTLKENFGIKISDNKIITLPVYLSQLPPYPTGIIRLVKRLGEILSENQPEETLAKLVLTELSDYYSSFFEFYCSAPSKGSKLDIISNIYRAHMWEDVRRNMYITEEIVKGMRELISVENLYPIFERC